MGLINRLDTHTISVFRNTSTLLTGVSAVSTNPNTTSFDSETVIQFEISSGTFGTYDVTGLIDGVTTTSTVTFPSGTSILKRVTEKAFDSLLSIDGITGTSSALVRTVTKTGTPLYRDSTVYSNIRARIDNVGPGSSVLVKGVTITPNTMICFIGADHAVEGGIEMEDKVVQQTTLDQSGTGAVSTDTYTVKDVNSYYNRHNFVYQELTLVKI